MGRQSNQMKHGYFSAVNKENRLICHIRIHEILVLVQYGLELRDIAS